MHASKWVGCSKYNTGRSGYTIKAVVPHIAECLTMAGVDATFAGPREASAHYCVDDTAIHQYVAEEDTAWAVGDWMGNRETISIEHVGTTEKPPSRATLDRSAELMADIARRYGWAEYVLGENVMLHKWYSATSCPATLDYDYLIERANELLRGAGGWRGPGIELAGADRRATAAAIANIKGARPAYMMTKGESWADAVTGIWIAGSLDANVLYGDEAFYITDGAGGIRLGSDDRYETNRYCLEIWEKVKGLDAGDTCLVVPGADDFYADAAAVAWASYNERMPVILYEDRKLFEDLISKFEHVVVVGNTVPKINKETERLAGPDRSATAVAVAERFGQTWGQPMICSGYSHADAIASAQWVGNDVLLFAEGPATVDALSRHRNEITTMYWVGDGSAVPYDRRYVLCEAAGLL